MSGQAFVPRPRCSVASAARVTDAKSDVRAAKSQASATTAEVLHRELCRLARYVHHHAGYMAMLGLAPDGVSFTKPVANLLALTEDLLAAAVAYDQAAGLDWFEIGQSLGLSARVARTYFSQPRERRQVGELRSQSALTHDEGTRTTTVAEGAPAAPTTACELPALSAKATPPAAECPTVVASVLQS